MTPLVYIEWLDSLKGYPSWSFLDEIKPDLPLCKSIGWLIYSDKNAKVIVPHLIMGNKNIKQQGCGEMTIPSVAIKKIKRIKI